MRALRDDLVESDIVELFLVILRFWHNTPIVPIRSLKLFALL